MCVMEEAIRFLKNEGKKASYATVVGRGIYCSSPLADDIIGHKTSNKNN